MDIRGGTSRKSENHQGTEKLDNNLLRNHGYKIRKRVSPEQHHEKSRTKKGAPQAPSVL